MDLRDDAIRAEERNKEARREAQIAIEQMHTWALRQFALDADTGILKQRVSCYVDKG